MLFHLAWMLENCEVYFQLEPSLEYSLDLDYVGCWIWLRDKKGRVILLSQWLLENQFLNCADNQELLHSELLEPDPEQDESGKPPRELAPLQDEGGDRDEELSEAEKLDDFYKRYMQSRAGIETVD